MAIYIDNKNRIKDILINVNGEKKNVVSAWVNKDGVPTKVFQANKGLKIVTWADGTDDEIAAMLDAHYAGIINIHDYWHVGDERVVHLSAMDAYANLNNESHVAQDVTMVLMNEGGKTLVASINGVNECAFIVGQKEVLSDHIFEDNGLNIRRYGYMNDPSSDDTLPRGWYNCERRIWCNTTYRDALPLSLKRIYYTLPNNTKKKIGINGTIIGSYFLRCNGYLKDADYSEDDHLPYGNFCAINNNGFLGIFIYEANTNGFSPFGCI